MIWAAINSKYRERGAVAFAADLGELAVASIVLAVAFASGLVFGAGALLIERLHAAATRPKADRASDPTSCRNAEDRDA